MKEYDYYIFDFDGTLADTVRGIKNAVVFALDYYGIKETDYEKLDAFIGPPLFESFKKLYNVTDERADELVAKYRERYKITASVESDIYDGVVDMLKSLRERGKTVAIASSKPRIFVDGISQYHGIDIFYDYIAAETFAHRHSSKKELITEVLEHFGVTDKAKALMVGDRFYDIEGAIGAGVDSAGAVYGFGTEEELRNAGATHILYSPLDLIK